MHLAAAPGGSVPSIQVGGTFLGSLGAAAAQLEKLYAAAGSHPSSPFMETTSWLHAMLVEAGCASLTVNQCHLPTQNPAGKLARASEYAKSDFFTKPLSSHGIGTLLAGVESFQRAGGAPGMLKYCRTQALVSERLSMRREPYWYPIKPRTARLIARGARFFGAADWRRRLGLRKQT